MLGPQSGQKIRQFDRKGLYCLPMNGFQEQISSLIKTTVQNTSQLQSKHKNIQKVTSCLVSVQKPDQPQNNLQFGKYQIKKIAQYNIQGNDKVKEEELKNSQTGNQNPDNQIKNGPQETFNPNLSQKMYEESDDEFDILNFSEFQSEYFKRHQVNQNKEEFLNFQDYQQGNQNLQNHQQGVWTRQQNTRYVAFIKLHAKDLRNKRKLIIKQWAEYATGGNRLKLVSRVDGHKACLRNKTFEQYADFMILKLSLSAQEVTQEIIKLQNHEKQQISIPEPQNFVKSRLNQFLTKFPSYQFPDHKIKVLIGRKINCQNVRYQIVPYSQQKDRKKHSSKQNSQQIKQKRFVIFFSFKTQAQEEKKFQQGQLNFNQNQNDQAKNKSDQTQNLEQRNKQDNRVKADNKEQKSSLNLQKQDLSFYVNLEIQNQTNEAQILARIDSAFKTQKDRPTCKLKDGYECWRHTEKLKFLVFISAFREAFQKSIEIPLGMFSLMSTLIKTKEPWDCYERFSNLRRKSNNFDLLIERQFENNSFDRQFVNKESNKIRISCNRSKRNFSYEKKGRLRTFETSKDISLINPTNIKDYIHGYMKQINIFLKKKQ